MYDYKYKKVFLSRFGRQITIFILYLAHHFWYMNKRSYLLVPSDTRSSWAQAHGYEQRFAQTRVVGITQTKL